MDSKRLLGWVGAIVVNEVIALLLVSFLKFEGFRVTPPSLFWKVMLPLILFLTVSWPLLLPISKRATLIAAYTAYCIYFAIAVLHAGILFPPGDGFGGNILLPIVWAAWGWLNVFILQLIRAYLKNDTPLKSILLGAAFALLTNPFWTQSLFMGNMLLGAFALLAVLLLVIPIVMGIIYVIKWFLAAD